MKKGINHEERLFEYLLGQLSEDEQAQIEQRYLADPDFHEEILAAERELIDRYVYGELANRELFETHFLSSPGRRQRVEFARALMQSPAAKAPAGSQLALPVRRQLQDAGNPVVQAPPVPVPDPPASNAPTIPAPQTPPPVRVATFILSPTLTRSTNETPTVRLKASDVQADFEIQLETSDYSR